MATAGHSQTPIGNRLALRDTTCLPCQAFYEYANGSWIKSAPIPAANGEVGTIQELNEHRREVLRRILDSLAVVPTSPGTIGAKLKAFYQSCTDVARIEEL